ncbi:PREDICTED: trichohyalin-like [Acropora digitifera]|uniref:trichohyalin-like n=1 Tax=Acropora digitifera TaxID=70779 RepID=UPI00077B1ED7|nr:PREDICTED: trichohyalin-like [Acropora digitifera]
MKAKEQELRATITDPMELDQATESLHSKYSKKMTSERLELQDNLKAHLLQDTELSEEEAEQIVTKLMMNMLEVDKRLAEEQNRQAMVLHERLAQRQALAQLRVAVNQQEKDEFDERAKQAFKNIDVVCKKGKLLEDQKERIMDEYRRDLRVLEEKHQQAVLRSQNDLRERLEKKREQRMKKLQMEQAVEKDEFNRKARQLLMEGNMTVEGFLEATHKLNVQQQTSREEEQDRADESETEELNNLRQASIAPASSEPTVLRRQNDLSERLKKKQEQRMKKLQMKQAVEKDEFDRKAGQLLMEGNMTVEGFLEATHKLNVQQQTSREEEQDRADESETEELNNLRQASIAPASSEPSVVFFVRRLRKQVMMEHDQNMVALNNHLQMTRLRQQKRLEKRLASRRARLVELTQRMEKERENQDKNDPEAMKTLSRGQNIEYQAEVKKIEVEHQAALEALRRRLETETDEALKEQEERLGKILGKLQVAVARREEIIKQQNEAIRSLEKKVVESMTRKGTLTDFHTNRLLKQHHKQVDNLNAQIEMDKEKQMQKIREKIEAKQLKKTRALEEKLYHEKEEHKNKAAQSALRIISISLAEQRHKRALEDIEREMQLDLTRQLEQLNKEMDEQLMVDLQEEERKFIATLAENSSAGEEELLETIKSSASEVGLDSKLTKSITKDVRKRVRSARTPAPDV